MSSGMMFYFVILLLYFNMEMMLYCFIFLIIFYTLFVSYYCYSDTVGGSFGDGESKVVRNLTKPPMVNSIIEFVSKFDCVNLHIILLPMLLHLNVI